MTGATPATPSGNTSGTGGARPAVPSKRNEEQLACPDYIHNNKNRVERLWARLKEWRAVAARYGKTARSLMGVLNLAAACDWSKLQRAPTVTRHGSGLLAVDVIFAFDNACLTRFCQ